MKHKHHIIPKHAGGTDDPSNLVELTIEEHAEAHRVLWETHGRWQDKMAWLALSGNITGEQARVEAVRHTWTGRKQTPEHIAKRTASRMRTNPTPTLGKKLPPASEERKRKISEAKKGRVGTRLGVVLSDETKQKMSLAAKNRRKRLPPTTPIDSHT